jgi:hypothetical protein
LPAAVLTALICCAKAHDGCFVAAIDANLPNKSKSTPLHGNYAKPTALLKDAKMASQAIQKLLRNIAKPRVRSPDMVVQRHNCFHGKVVDGNEIALLDSIVSTATE